MTTAASYVRRASAAGAIVARRDSPFVLESMRKLGGYRNLGMMKICLHADPSLVQLATPGGPQVLLIPVLGKGAFNLYCESCFERDRPSGCQGCRRHPAPSVRLVVSPPIPEHGEVFTAVLCRYCRGRGRV